MALILSYFFIPFVFSSVLFGFLGDRYSRKRLLQIGTLIEAASQLICGASNSFTTFAGGRILLGVFQAAGSCITPTVLADMYLNESKRTMMSGIFSTAMPIGVAVAFISAPVITSYFGFRTVYYLSAVRHLAIVVSMQFMPEYQRGAGEILDESKNSRTDQLLTQKKMKKEDDDLEQLQKSEDSVLSDLKYLFSTRTYLLVSLGFSLTSGLSEIGIVFSPELLRRKLMLIGEQPACPDDFFETLATHNVSCSASIEKVTTLKNLQNLTVRESDFDCNSCTSEKVGTILGLIGFFGGLGGIMIGITIYNRLYEISKRTSGAWVSGLGAGIAGFVSYLIIGFQHNYGSLYIWFCLGAMFTTLSFSFGINLDCINRVIRPNKRALANSIMNLIGAGIGGSIPPYLSGVIIENYLEEEMLERFIEEDSYLEKLKVYQEVRMEAFLNGQVLCIACGLLAMVFYFLSALFWAADEDSKDRESEDLNE